MKNEQGNPFVYGLVGVLLGGIIVWFVATSAINTGSTGMMRMMGIRSANRSSNTQSNLDRHFIEQMIPHHEAAIEMSKLALDRSTHEEIKTLADSIIKSQSKEIENMRQWYKDWYGVDVAEDSDVDMGMGRGIMHGGMMGDEVDTKALKNASDFDKAFIEEMIPHHQMAVMMANMLLQETERPELEQLGNDIVDAQTKEISQMQAWYKSWYE